MAAAGPRSTGAAALAVVLGIVAVVELVAGLSLVVRHGDPAGPRGGSAAAPGGQPARGGSGRSAAGVDADRLAAARQVLAARAAAVLHGDATAFAATADPRQPALRARQRRLVTNLAGVPLASWSYQVAPAAAAPLPAGRRARLGPSAWLASVTLRYALRDYDQRPATVRQYLTFVHRGARWYLGGDRDGAAAGLRADRQLWDFGPVVGVAGARSLVLGHPGGRAGLAEVAREADRDVPRVAGFWGWSGWRGRAVVLVPGSQAELAALIGSHDVGQLAAVETVEAESATAAGAGPGGDRILLNPRTYPQLGTLGRRVVVTHELTHVATRSATGAATPDWLVEGIADYAAFRGTGVPVRSAARELADRIAAGHLPARLPADTAFAGSARHLPAAYEQAWLACRYVAARWGERALIRLYRAVGRAGGEEAAALRSGLAATLHVTPAGFTGAWRRYLRAELS